MDEQPVRPETRGSAPPTRASESPSPGDIAAKSNRKRQHRQPTTKSKRVEIVVRIAPTRPQQSEHLKPVTDPPVPLPDLSPPKLPEGGTPNSQPIPNRESQIANEAIPARMLNEFVYCPRLFYYGMLTKDCTLAALAVGFDPYIGFYHQPRFGRPALGLDLMEEFRPLVAESTVLSCINNRVVTEKDFVRAGQALNLTASGRKRFFQMYEQRMSSLITHPLFDYKVSYRRALELQARLLAKALTGEIPEYVPLLTR